MKLELLLWFMGGGAKSPPPMRLCIAGGGGANRLGPWATYQYPMLLSSIPRRPMVKQQHAIEHPASSCIASTSIGAVSQYCESGSPGPSLSSFRRGFVRSVAGNLVPLAFRLESPLLLCRRGPVAGLGSNAKRGRFCWVVSKVEPGCDMQETTLHRPTLSRHAMSL